MKLDLGISHILAFAHCLGVISSSRQEFKIVRRYDRAIGRRYLSILFKIPNSPIALFIGAALIVIDNSSIDIGIESELYIDEVIDSKGE